MGSTKAKDMIFSWPPFTDAEKKILKDYGGEHKFLRMYGLDLHEDEERKEGRAIIKAIVGAENAPEYEDDERSLAELKGDPTSHIADWHFRSDQLER